MNKKQTELVRVAIISREGAKKDMVLHLRYDNDYIRHLDIRLIRWFEHGKIDAGVETIDEYFDKLSYMWTVRIGICSDDVLELVQHNIERALM